MNTQVCLVFIFNHRYDENIEKLEEIYKERFSNRCYLVQFYDGPKNNVIPIYESSYSFQGYIAQAYHHIYKEQYSHYIFISDDLLINPNLNEDNILAEMGLSDNSSYIKTIDTYTDAWGNGEYTPPITKGFLDRRYFRCMNELPTTNEARDRFNCNGVSINEQLPYPMAVAYSDLIIIPRQELQPFCKLCGVFAAMNIFAEIAIPTAMVLACDNILLEKHIRWFGEELWQADRTQFLHEVSSDIDQVLATFNNDQLYIHPVKLSVYSGGFLAKYKKATQKILQNIFNNASGKRIGIYGAGVHTVNLINEYLKQGNKINFELFIFDSSPEKWGNKLCQYEIFNPDEISSMCLDRVIISSYSFQEEIYQKLHKYNLVSTEIVKIYGTNDERSFWM